MVWKNLFLEETDLALRIQFFPPPNLKVFKSFIHLCYIACLLSSKSNSLTKLILINMIHLNFRYSPSLFTVTVPPPTPMFCLETWKQAQVELVSCFPSPFASLLRFLVSLLYIIGISFSFYLLHIKISAVIFSISKIFLIFEIFFSLNSLFLLHRCNNLVCLKMTIN